MAFDLARVRGLYPTLGGGMAHLEGTYGTLQPETVVRAIITTLRSAPSQPGSASAASHRAGASIDAARRAVADLVGGKPADVVLGGNLASLLARFAGVLAHDWQLGDEVVLNRLDRDMNVGPWLGYARAVGAVVHWAEADLETGELPDWQYDRLIGERTRIVTVPIANPVTGSLPDVRAIADRAHEVGALVVADAGAAMPHMPLDIARLGVDLLGLAISSFGGPTSAAVVARPGLLQELDTDGTAPIPQRFEHGPLPVELLDGVTAAVDHLAVLDEIAFGSRRERLITSIESTAKHGQDLLTHLDAKLRRTPKVTVLGNPARRVPTLSFTVEGATPRTVGDYLSLHGVSVWTGESGMSQLMGALGVDELGGAVHVGLMPHTSWNEVDLLLDRLGTFVRG